MDERDVVRRARNSLRAKKSDAQIMKGFQDRGYTLEYAHAILRKARQPRRLLFFFSLFFLLLFVSGGVGYVVFVSDLGGSGGSVTAKVVGDKKSSGSISGGSHSGDSVPVVVLNADFIRNLLTSIDAHEYLHKNLFFDKPKINFRLGGKQFGAVIAGGKIDASPGLVDDADVVFVADEETVNEILGGSDPYAAIDVALAEGDIEIERLVSDAELLSKGYASWYDSLN